VSGKFLFNSSFNIYVPSPGALPPGLSDDSLTVIPEKNIPQLLNNNESFLKNLDIKLDNYYLKLRQE
jgi:hypothetical protein